MDPFLPCSLHHFESRPMVLTRCSTQGTDRSTSSTNGGGTNAVYSAPTSPNEIRTLPVRRSGRSRARYLPESEAFLSGVHPILTWVRNHRNNTATTSAGNNIQLTGQGSGLSSTLAGQMRVGMESVLHTLEREVNLDRARSLNIQSTSSSLAETVSALSTVLHSVNPPNEILTTPICNIPFFRDLEGRFVLVDLFMLIARNWTLHDLLNLNTVDLHSSIVQNPISRNTVTLV